MTLSDTGKAISAVTELIRSQISNNLQNVSFKSGKPDVTVGRPEQLTTAGNVATTPRLNLFLYEMHFDPFLKNISPQKEQPPPLWLVAKYLLTAFDSKGDSDTVEAQEYLGEAIRVLHGLSFLFLNNQNNQANKALEDNPEVLKITFDDTPSETLGKLMQGYQEKYRFSIGFEVRPIMIATNDLPSYSLLIGVDYTQSPPTEIGNKGINVESIASPGPLITTISPSKFEVNSSLTVFGSNMNLSDFVSLDLVKLSITSRQKDKLECLIDPNIGQTISAGTRTIYAGQTLPNGRQRSSNLILGDLLPTITDIKTNTTGVPRGNPFNDTIVTGTIDVTGFLLGTDKDDIIAALYDGNKTVKTLSDIGLPPGPKPQAQTKTRIKINDTDTVIPGTYRIIYRVNGQQAKNSPKVDLTP